MKHTSTSKETHALKEGNPGVNNGQKSPILLAVLLSFVFGFLGHLTAAYIFPPSDSSRIKEHYETETSGLVSPSTLRKRMDANDQTFVLVDLRSKGEYDKEHILHAINIPAVTMSEEQIVEAFKKLPKDKEIIVHCYSMVCMLGRQTGQALAKNDIYVKELGIGWSEWKYYWGLWNPGEDPSKGTDYLVTSSEEEKNKPAPLIAPCSTGDFGC